MNRSEEEENFEAEFSFHRREWAVQRVGWVCIAAFILLAFAGLFGGGPLSDTSVSSKEAGTIEYERYLRKGANAAIKILPAATALQGSVVRVGIPPAYLQTQRIQRITPEPSSVRMSGERLLYEFSVANGESSIIFFLEPQQVGRHSAQITIGDAAPLTVSQFTYP
jgi:hypothetical protein